MSTKADIVAALIEPGIAALRWLWHKAHGEDTQPDELELRRIAISAVQAQLQRGELEIQRLAAIAGVAIAEAELARAMLELSAALRALEGKPGLVERVLTGVQMTVLKPGEPMPLDVDLAPIDTDELTTQPLDEGKSK